ncbi:MAG: ferrochelatase [Polyangiales bacterium]|nr:ferrochelatase [Myxococcales bacterium]
MNLALDVVLGKLEAVDRSVAQVHGPLASLAPGAETATPLRTLGERAAARTEDPHVLAAFAESLISIVESECSNFPENIFWDFDYLAASLLRSAHRSERGAVEYLREATELVVGLHELFGMHTAVRFRYGHDFLYGFDWARWVKRDPEERASEGPFDLAFLRFSRERGHELLELIHGNDTKYPPLPDGTTRNPFGFSRDPADERRLHQDLAERDCLPVRAWDPDATPSWDRPFTEIRAARAEALRIADHR